MNLYNFKSVILRSAIFISLTLLIFFFSLSPTLVQSYYSTGIYTYISATLRFISSIFPFAIGDIVYALLIGFVFYKIYRFYQLIRKKQLQKSHRITVPLQVLNFGLLLYIIFKLAWGLNYSRPSISEELNIGNQKYNVKELLALGNYFVDKTNALKNQCLADGNEIHFSLRQLREQAVAAYAKMAKKNNVFSYPQPSVKSVLVPWVISKVGIEGYYAPLSGEANINTDLPNFVKPYVTCHEIGHQLGIAYEDEANLMGYLTASNSDNIYFQYSANYEMLRYILFEIRMKSPDDYKAIRSKISEHVLADFKAEKEFWRKYNGQMFGYMDAAFDRFLKLNNQKKGIDSYQDIVIWLWNIHKEEIRK
ncbi:DUF3810 domain-containing protein [Pedobacter rhizosphaerae]|uniref:DUF3810 domain-containing protein n=1 Tax=Pedobacter rhizosphaerae TaxID=390241 RepID=A0A1H9W610_9SPHI|nr:DUF3810 domain-containing protein [Pedobacter rhizosphaerae]SES29107.1 Protein of unknown function [Pedobacter rhizosphaerae]